MLIPAGAANPADAVQLSLAQSLREDEPFDRAWIRAQAMLEAAVTGMSKTEARGWRDAVEWARGDYEASYRRAATTCPRFTSYVLTYGSLPFAQAA